ncbi:hypothetical protein TSOC_000999, partial [Tetrabaena socialis]
MWVAAGGREVFSPDRPAAVYVWSGAHQPSFEYPELSRDGPWGLPALLARPNLGVALSGGGYRAATCALGWVRGLHLLGLLPHVRYMSSNSGGSWFNGALSYSGFPVGPFLGPYVPPANLTKDALRSSLPPGSFGDTLADKTIVADAIKGVLKDLFVPGRGSFSGWTAAVAEAFLDPYGLGLQNGSVTALGTRGNVSSRVAAAYPGVPLYAAMASFPIILGSILRAETDQVFYPVEFTPLYAGDPALNTTVDPALGPGFVEPLGLNSPAPKRPPPGAPPNATLVGLQGALNVTSSKLVPLGTYVGISSSFIAQGVRPERNAGYALTGAERLQYWNQYDYRGATLSFADGAGADNLAVTPLLRRRVSSILVFVAALNSADMSPADWAVAQYDVAGLFGAVPANATSYEGLKNGITGVRPDVFNKALQVFPTEGYAQLYDALARQFAAGQPSTHRAAYTVLDNPAQAVHGGWTVENSSVTALGTRGNVSSRVAAAYPGVPLYAAMASFPIILGAILLAETDQVFYPFEFTPLYAGDPALNTAVDPALGPGFVEPLGLNSPAPERPPPGAPPNATLGALNLTASVLVPLGTYVGISSSFIAQGVRAESDAGYALSGTERLQYWNQYDYRGATLSFADGAGADNLAVTPLLRRRVSSILVFVAALNSADMPPADWAVAQYDVAGLFGAVPANATSYPGLENGITGVQPDVFNKALQVFPTEGYAQLYDALAQRFAAGQPSTHRAAYTVLDNPAQAVHGGWTVEVLWVFNMQAGRRRARAG